MTDFMLLGRVIFGKGHCNLFVRDDNPIFSYTVELEGIAGSYLGWELDEAI